MIRNIIKTILIILFISLTFYFSLFKIDTGAILFAIFSIFFTLLFYGNKFEIVEILGAKFKLKELNNSIEELKELSKLTASISLDLLQECNRWIDAEDYEKRKLDFFLKIDKILSNVQISEQEKEEIYEKYWHKWVLFDYANNAISSINLVISNNTLLTTEDRDHLKSLLCNPHCYSDVISAYKFAIQKGIKFDDNTNEKMNDFEYYINNKKHKNKERWLNLRN